MSDAGKHRHYYRPSWGGTCRCGEYEPGTEDYEAIQRDRKLVDDAMWELRAEVISAFGVILDAIDRRLER